MNKIEEIELFKLKVKEFDKKIKDYYVSKENEKQLISDGIVDIDEYINSKYRIMWVLKEPYGGGNWSISEELKKVHEGSVLGSPATFKPIIYVTYGILNSINSFEQLDSIPNKKLILKNIAYINLQKLSAKSRTNDKDIEDAFKKHKGFLLDQIKTYQPNIVIGGNTLDLLKREWNCELIEGNHFIMDGVLFIDTEHPAQTLVSHKVYVERIINRVFELMKKHSLFKD